MEITPIEVMIRNGNLSAPGLPGQLATLERFEILRLIGAGGMGVVFLARDPKTDLKVAIKMLRPELAVQEKAVKHLLKEVRFMRGLDHPHILPILEVSERKAGPYFVMPYLESGSLARLIQPGEALKPDVALRIARQIAGALSLAHSKGIIHRDIKPGNILLDAEGNAILTDFGLARTVFNDSLMDVDHSHCEGTGPYMSPEVAAGKAEDTRCDIYSFGAVLYELLTGFAPYEGQTTAEILQNILAGPPKSIHARNPKAPPDLTAIAEGAMARLHRDRYADMVDVVADLERVEKGLSPLGPHRQWKAPQRWPSLIRRRPMIVVMTVVLLALVWLAVVWLRPSLELIRQFPLPEGASGGNVALGDWDGDRDPELFVANNKKCSVLSTDGSVIAEFGPEEPLETSLSKGLVTDVNGDGLDDVFLCWAGGGKAHTAAFNKEKFELMRCSIDDNATPSTQWGTVHTGIGVQVISDLNHDGQREVLALASTGWGLQPRGLYCFAATNQTLLWKVLTAAYPTRLVVADFDGDGKDEIVFGTDATANGGALPDGTDDGHSYLYAVSSRGTVLWRKELGGTFTRCEPLLVLSNTNVAPRLYAWVQGHPEPRRNAGQPEVGVILSFDSQGKEVAKYDAGAWLLSCLAEDVNGDGQPEILATDRHGLLHVLNLDLKWRQLVRITPDAFSWVELRLIAATNVAGATGKQLVFSTTQCEHTRGHNVGKDRTEINVIFFHNNAIEVWDTSLHHMATYPLEKKLREWPDRHFQIADWDRDGVPEIVVLDRTVRVLKFRSRRF